MRREFVGLAARSPLLMAVSMVFLTWFCSSRVSSSPFMVFPFISARSAMTLVFRLLPY
jgi:hypothetical protein